MSVLMYVAKYLQDNGMLITIDRGTISSESEHVGNNWRLAVTTWEPVEVRILNPRGCPYGGYLAVLHQKGDTDIEIHFRPSVLGTKIVNVADPASFEIIFWMLTVQREELHRRWLKKLTKMDEEARKAINDEKNNYRLRFMRKTGIE